MSGTGYDLMNTIYSQDGRLFQLEYARKSIEGAETVVGLICKDGVILGAEKICSSPLLTVDANRRVFSITETIGMVICGRQPDGAMVVRRAREEAEQYLSNFGRSIPGYIMAERVANFVHAHTLYGAYRPFGASFTLASWDEGKPYLYSIDNSGELRGYYGMADGKGRQVAKTEIEKANKEATVEENLKVVAKAIVAAHEEFKEKTYEFEASWIGPQTDYKHKVVDFALRNQLKQQAEDELDEE